MKASFLHHLEQHLSERLHNSFKITGSEQVYGGDINTTYILTAGSSRYFIKCNDSGSADMFQKEHNGLQLLKAKSRLLIPEPLLYGQFESTAYLVMDCLEQVTFTPKSWQVLAEGLADLHRQTQPQFGLHEDNYIGGLPQPNQPADTWADFYAEQRVLPLAKKAFENALCTKEDVKLAEAICNKLSAIFPAEPPALLHGDLWNGNVMACTNDKAAIYDPAVYYGHREMDIAMTLLFGGFDAVFYNHYNDAFLLENGWQQRVALCQFTRC